MNPTFNARLPQAIAQPVNAFNAAAERPNENEKTTTLSAERMDFFHNSINETLEGRSLCDADVTALLREVDRLMRHWPDDASGVVLADDISPSVRQALTAAIDQAGQTVIEYQPPSCSFHVNATEMKRPPPGDREDVSGPEVPSATSVATHLPADMKLLGTEFFSGRPKLDALRIKKSKARKGLDLRADLHVALTGGDATGVRLAMGRIRQAGVSPDTLCKLLWVDNCIFHALDHGDAAVVTAFMEGLQGAGLSREQLGEVISKRYSSDDSSVSPMEAAMSAGHADTAVAFMRGLVELGLGKEKIGRLTLLAAAPALTNGHAAAVTASIRCLYTLGFVGSEIVGAFGKPDVNEAINDAIAEGHVAAVTAFIVGLKAAGFSGTQIADAIRHTPHEIDGLTRAMQSGNAACVTAFMQLMESAGVPAHDLYGILIYCGNWSDDCDSHALMAALPAGKAAAVSAFMKGLPGWGLSPQQVHRVVAVEMPSTLFWTVSRLTQIADALEAYREGLLLLEQHRLITAKDIDAQVTPLIQKLRNG